MRIGIGVTTYNRPECIKKCINQIVKHTNMHNVLLYVARDTDEDRQGVAKRKNECLRVLQNCDYIFLFDDDCYPINDYWINFFIRAGENHLLFLNDKLHNLKDLQGTEGVRYYNDCGGAFMYMTKNMVQNVVGAFNEKFDTYGFEHADWSMRYAGNRTFMMLEGTDQYLYSEDYSNPNHKSSITDEEKKQHVRNNWDKFFKEPIKQIYIPL